MPRHASFRTALCQCSALHLVRAGSPARKGRSLKRIPMALIMMAKPGEVSRRNPGEVQNMGLNKLSGRAGAAPTRGGGGGESLVGRILLVILACSAALLVTGCLGADEAAQEEAEEEAEASSDRPNIIFVLT